MLENAHQFRANPQRGDGSAAQSNGASSAAAHGRNGQPHHAGEDVTSVEPRDPLLARQYAQRLIPLLARVIQVPSFNSSKSGFEICSNNTKTISLDFDRRERMLLCHVLRLACCIYCGCVYSSLHITDYYIIQMQAGLPAAVRKGAMVLLCKILALSSPNMMNDIVNAPAEQNRESSSQKAVARCDGEVAGMTPPTQNRLEKARPSPMSPEDAARGPAVRDGRLIATPDSRDRLNGGERIRSRGRKCGLVCCLLM
jgi:hypothetical protein